MLNVSTRILFILCIVLIIVNIFAYVIFGTASQPVKYSAFMKRMEQAPKLRIGLDKTLKTFTITNDWGAFNGLRDFINILGQVIGYAVYLVVLVINLLLAVVWFLYLFGITSFSAIKV